MNRVNAAAIKTALVLDMQALAIEGIARYGDVARCITTSEEAAYRLCHHDFYGLTQQDAATVLGIKQSAVAQRLASLKDKAPQLFPILSQKVALVYHCFTADNMPVKQIAEKLKLTPRYCWRVLKKLWDTRKNNGLYFRSGFINRLHYRTWMDKHVKEVF